MSSHFGHYQLDWSRIYLASSFCRCEYCDSSDFSNLGTSTKLHVPPFHAATDMPRPPFPPPEKPALRAPDHRQHDRSRGSGLGPPRVAPGRTSAHQHGPARRSARHGLTLVRPLLATMTAIAAAHLTAAVAELRAEDVMCKFLGGWIELRWHGWSVADGFLGPRWGSRDT